MFDYHFDASTTVISGFQPSSKKAVATMRNDICSEVPLLRREAEKPHHRPTQGQPKCCPYRRPGGV